MDLTDFIYKALDEEKFVFGLYIDLKKAFDTVAHNILLYKMQHYGIRGIALEWFESYLKERKQFTKGHPFRPVKKLASYFYANEVRGL